MKKLISAMFVAVLMTAGLVVATGSTASANCTPTQYSGCVSTKTKVTGPNVVTKGQKATFCVKVTASGVEPKGTVKVKIKRNKGGLTTIKNVNVRGENKACVTTARLTQTGGYSLTANYKSPAGSKFINSVGSKSFDVAS